MTKVFNSHQKQLLGRGWEGLGGFRRVWRGSGEFGRVWEAQECVNVIENKCLEEFGRIWADLEIPKVCNGQQIHRQKGNPSDPRGSQRGPKGARR